MQDLEVSTLMGIAGLIIGLGFGALTQRTNYCSMGAISDVVSFGDYRRARAWALAIAIAIIGAQGLHHFGLIDLGQSIYLGSSLNLLGAVAGGLVFGFGMVIASGCPGRNLVRVGGGDLRALVVLIFIALFGYMALRGLSAPARVTIQANAALDLKALDIADQHLGSIASGLFGFAEGGGRVAVAALAVLGLIVFCFSSRDFRRSPVHIAAGLGLGVLVTAGWWATGVLGADDFEPARLASLTFVAPTGNGLQYLMTYTGATMNFGIASVGGAILGAFLAAVFSRQFAISAFHDNKDTMRHMIGGALMGTGGVLALGCTIGQGMSGISTLSASSLIALVSIVLGGVAGIKYMERAA